MPRDGAAGVHGLPVDYCQLDAAPVREVRQGEAAGRGRRSVSNSQYTMPREILDKSKYKEPFAFGDLVGVPYIGPDRYHDSEHGNLLNCLYLIAVTFLCVGYGDVVPNTYCGRGICLGCGIMVSPSPRASPLLYI